MQVYVWNVSAYFSMTPQDAVWKQSLELLEEGRRQKLEGYRNQKDKARSLAAGLLLRYGFLQYLDSRKETGLEAAMEAFPCEKGTKKSVLPDGKETKQHLLLENKESEPAAVNLSDMSDAALNLTCVLGENEKPSFRAYPEVHFNLSHSGDYVALILGGRECGIDIQEPRKLSENFSRRFFHPEEREWLLSHPGEEIRIFSMKESVIKCTGKGIGRGMEGFSVIPLLQGEMIREQQMLLSGVSRMLENGYALAVSVEGGTPPLLTDRIRWLEGIFKL